MAARIRRSGFFPSQISAYRAQRICFRFLQYILVILVRILNRVSEKEDGASFVVGALLQIAAFYLSGQIDRMAGRAGEYFEYSVFLPVLFSIALPTGQKQLAAGGQGDKHTFCRTKEHVVSGIKQTYAGPLAMRGNCDKEFDLLV